MHSVGEDGNIVLELRHNAFSDLRDDTNSKMTLGGTYVSFPILDVIKKDSAKIIVKWLWYETAGMAYSSVEKEYSVEYNWKRDGFEQVPQTLTLRSPKELQ